MSLPVYLTLAQVKAYMPGSEVSQTAIWDTQVTTLCTTMSRVWDTETFREAGAYAVSSSTARTFDGVPVTAVSYAASIEVDEMAAVPDLVEVSLNGDPNGFVALQSTDWFLWPYNALARGKPAVRIDLNRATGQRRCWPTAPRSVQVTAKFGYSLTVPDDVTQALLLLAVKFIRKAQQNYLDTGVILDTGQVMTGMKEDKDLSRLIVLYQAWRDHG